MNKDNCTPTHQSLFYSRNDNNDIRWGDVAFQAELLSLSLKTFNCGIWGYPDDSGIALNGGRLGAKYAPEFIRRFLYRITSPLNLTKNAIADFGDWKKENNQELQIEKIAPILSEKLHNHPMLTLGGGHDYASVDGAGFLNWCQGLHPQIRPLILNFDAHLDVRPWTNGLNSGTSFSWLLENFKDKFDFIEIGIQKICSSPHHHQWLKNQNGHILDLDYIKKVGLLRSIKQMLAGTSLNQPCYISFDIDVFSQSLAPGCSQSWDGGLLYNETLEALKWLFENKNVRLFGIYEVSPPLDIDQQTSKLAASIADEFLRSKKSN